MKLKRLYIESYKNLKEFKIEFQGSNINAILGKNGSGKSNLFEFIIDIFINIENGTENKHNYEIEYSINEDGIKRNVLIKHNGEYEVSMDNKTDSKKYKKFPMKKYKDYLPRFIFAYYSGMNERLKSGFYEERVKFHEKFLRKEGEELQTRRFLYAERKYSLFVLLIFLIMSSYDKQIKDLLANTLNIESLSYVLFKLHKPYWTKSKETGYFWGSRGFVKPFLEKLYEEALSPLKLNNITNQVEREQGLPKRETQDFIYLYFNDVEKLRRIMDSSKIKDDETPDRFLFKSLESMYISDLVEDIIIETRASDKCKSSVKFKDLSEGEMQLFSVLGLLKFTNTKNSLFLLDEPDTHLNPAWSRDYVNELLRKIIGQDKETNTHILITTHDPVLIGGMEKEDVIIMHMNECGIINATNPEIDPKGSGYAGILTSDIFDLNSAISPELEEDIQNKTILLFKEDRTPDDEEKLAELTEKMKDYDYEIPQDDPLYAEYIRAREIVMKALKDNSTTEKQKRNQASIETLKRILNLE